MSKTQTPELVTADQSPALPADPRNLTFIVATPQVVGRSESKVSQLTVDNALHNVRAEKSFETLADEYLRHRRMFPGTDSVRETLGDDAPDLAGRSDAYRTAVARLNESTRDALVNALRHEGMTVKAATGQADAELERIRKSVSRSIRLAVETEAKSIMAAEGRETAARFVLGHGFGYSGEVTSKAHKGVIESKAWKLVDGQLALPEGKIIAENGVDVIDANQAQEPAEQSDQATPAETAETQLAKLLAAAGVSVGDPVGLVNLCVGILNGTATLIPTVKLDAKVRKSLRSSLLSAVKRVVGELEDTLPASQSVDVVAEVAAS